ncbi:hypothetical protein HaLaN_32465, partial [Haematococcus lacustris]
SAAPAQEEEARIQAVGTALPVASARCSPRACWGLASDWAARARDQRWLAVRGRVSRRTRHPRYPLSHLFGRGYPCRAHWAHHQGQGAARRHLCQWQQRAGGRWTLCSKRRCGLRCTAAAS